MKIAIVTPQLSQGGAEKMVYHLAIGLKRLGDEVVVFSSGGYYREKLLQSAVESPVFPLASPSTWVRLLFLKTFAHSLRKGDYDIFHVQTIPLAFLIRFISRLYSLKGKTVLTLHGSPEWKIQWIFPILRKLRIKVYAVSNRLATQVQGVYIPNAVDLPSQNSNRPTRFVLESMATPMGGGSQTTLKVLIVARLVPEKGIDLWLKAVKQLKEDGFFVETWLAGEGLEREKLRKYAQENDLIVHFLGWIEDPWKLKQEINLFVLPSRREGEPLALLEAMASLLPVLATNVGGIPDLLKEGRGICVEPSPEGLSRGVRDFQELSHLECRKMLERSLEFVHSRTWKACVATYKEQYQTVLTEED
jgi:glycosyltransferase involved in cell wall biosynthesis